MKNEYISKQHKCRKCMFWAGSCKVTGETKLSGDYCTCKEYIEIGNNHVVIRK